MLPRNLQLLNQIKFRNVRDSKVITIKRLMCGKFDQACPTANKKNYNNKTVGNFYIIPFAPSRQGPN